MVSLAYNPSTWKSEQEGCQEWKQRESVASFSYRARPCHEEGLEEEKKEGKGGGGKEGRREKREGRKREEEEIKYFL